MNHRVMEENKERQGRGERERKKERGRERKGERGREGRKRWRGR